MLFVCDATRDYTVVTNIPVVIYIDIHTLFICRQSNINSTQINPWKPNNLRDTEAEHVGKVTGLSTMR